MVTTVLRRPVAVVSSAATAAVALARAVAHPPVASARGPSLRVCVASARPSLRPPLHHDRVPVWEWHLPRVGDPPCWRTHQVQQVWRAHPVQTPHQERGAVRGALRGWGAPAAGGVGARAGGRGWVRPPSRSASLWSAARRPTLLSRGRARGLVVGGRCWGGGGGGVPWRRRGCHPRGQCRGGAGTTPLGEGLWGRGRAPRHPCRPAWRAVARLSSCGDRHRGPAVGVTPRTSTAPWRDGAFRFLLLCHLGLSCFTCVTRCRPRAARRAFHHITAHVDATRGTARGDPTVPPPPPPSPAVNPLQRRHRRVEHLPHRARAVEAAQQPPPLVIRGDPPPLGGGERETPLDDRCRVVGAALAPPEQSRSQHVRRAHELQHRGGAAAGGRPRRPVGTVAGEAVNDKAGGKPRVARRVPAAAAVGGGNAAVPVHAGGRDGAVRRHARRVGATDHGGGGGGAPPPPPARRIASWRSRTVTSDGTMSPARSIASMAAPPGVGRAASARSSSPADRCTAPERAARAVERVPLPLPGPPMTKTMAGGQRLGRAPGASAVGGSDGAGVGGGGGGGGAAADAHQRSRQGGGGGTAPGGNALGAGRRWGGGGGVPTGDGCVGDTRG
ncbi:hypothetical protein BU14_0107s0031 [Porphyra umbilicalis]|uniref:Uncharacterized protein n=1 Tax=Porphyra umbilicalis TaxID=2786 RepID=A0A1X6PCZ9_PORUM|nr:hypothetical protein BU14_0107s0031 [Porphyra umbilicalis]|eukprot:OSX78523.1 hypothetical protein BU14_0107s0031 [Porphyra umbilicalis]